MTKIVIKKNVSIKINNKKKKYKNNLKMIKI